MEYVRIGEDRIGAIIGKDGEVRAKIEEELGVEMDVNSRDGVVTIENRGDDPLSEWKARDVVRAISLGVSMEDALKLKNDEYLLNIIDLHDIVGRSKKAVARQKARIIGKAGRTKDHIASLTGAALSVKGRRVVIVGRAEDATIAREAVEALAGGLPHGVVYKVLEKKCAQLRKEDKTALWRT